MLIGCDVRVKPNGLFLRAYDFHKITDVTIEPKLEVISSDREHFGLSITTTILRSVISSARVQVWWVGLMCVSVSRNHVQVFSARTIDENLYPRARAPNTCTHGPRIKRSKNESYSKTLARHM